MFISENMVQTIRDKERQNYGDFFQIFDQLFHICGHAGGVCMDSRGVCMDSTRPTVL